MNRSYYENFQFLNTCMKFFMVVILCMTAEVCETIYETDPYNTRYECQMESATVRDYMIENYPMSAGEIYCLNEEELLLYNEWMKDGGSPTFRNEIDA